MLYRYEHNGFYKNVSMDWNIMLCNSNETILESCVQFYSVSEYTSTKWIDSFSEGHLQFYKVPLQKL